MTEHTVVEIHIRRGLPAPLSVVVPDGVERVGDVIAEQIYDHWSERRTTAVGHVVHELLDTWSGCSLGTGNLRLEAEDCIVIDLISGLVHDPMFHKTYSLSRWLKKRL